MKQNTNDVCIINNTHEKDYIQNTMFHYHYLYDEIKFGLCYLLHMHTVLFLFMLDNWKNLFRKINVFFRRTWIHPVDVIHSMRKPSLCFFQNFKHNTRNWTDQMYIVYEIQKSVNQHFIYRVNTVMWIISHGLISLFYSNESRTVFQLTDNLWFKERTIKMKWILFHRWITTWTWTYTIHYTYY